MYVSSLESYYHVFYVLSREKNGKEVDNRIINDIMYLYIKYT